MFEFCWICVFFAVCYVVGRILERKSVLLFESKGGILNGFIFFLGMWIYFVCLLGMLLYR